MQYNSLVETLLHKRVNSKDKRITFVGGTNQEEALSYPELYDSALRILAYLQNLGLRPEDELVIQIPDNKNFLCIFWACILGGIIPVPLSIGHNSDHKLKLFNVWRLLKNPHLVTFTDQLNNLKVFANQIGLDSQFAEIESKTVHEINLFSSPSYGSVFKAHKNDIAFVQFSSGSTGNPKGIVLTHANLIANMQSITTASKYTVEDSMISWMPLTHDMGLIGFHLNPLFVGMNQYIIPTNLFVRSPALWLDKATAYKSTILSSPNFGYRYLLKHCGDGDHYNWDLSNVRILYNGAEPISIKLCDEFLNKFSRYGLKTYAMCPVYGLAEASLAVSISGLEDEVISIDVDRNKLQVGQRISTQCEENSSVSFVNVGRPIDNCSVRIVTDNNVLVQEEIIGHIQIKGKNVSSGYYGNESETKKTIDEQGWLKTGDLGFLKDQSLYVTGRAKDIIFINGQNFYPHDIERVAETIEGIELNKIVVAGFFNEVTQREEAIAFVYHRSSVKEFLPIANSLKLLVSEKIGFDLDHIIPVKDIPKTTSGKLQRFKLLQLYMEGVFDEIETQLNEMISDANSPVLVNGANETEKRILAIWSKTLKRNDISLTQKFFEIGGNSLRAAELGMMLSKEFQVDLPLAMLYEKQTIKELSLAINDLPKQNHQPIPITPEEEFYLLSSAQKSVYFATIVDKQTVAYNIPVAFLINGTLDANKLDGCIQRLISRHDSLRMSFHMTDTPMLKISGNVDFHLKCFDCKRDEVSKQLRENVRPFDLSQLPLFRAVLLKLGKKEHILFLDFHHIISDGLSIYNFISELLNLYTGNNPPAELIQYKDYIKWEAENLASEKVSSQKEYWINHLKGGIPILDLPLDFPRPVIFNTAGQKLEFSIGQEKTEQIKLVAQANNCTVHVLLYALYNILLAKYTGQQEIMVGIPVSGRNHPDLLNMLGMFVNNLAVKNLITATLSFPELVRVVKDKIAQAFANQHYRFGDLINDIHTQREVSRNSILDTMFIYQNMGLPGNENVNFTVSRYFFDPGFSKFDLSLEVFEDRDSISYNIEYATKLFKKETIEGLAKHFDNLINQVIAKSDIALSELSLLTKEESNLMVRNLSGLQEQYPTNHPIHRLFEEQVIRTPTKIAVEHEKRTMSYQQLNDRANQVALFLQSKGNKLEDVISVVMKRSPQLIITILGILKAGACYLPIDNDLPDERIKFLVSNSGSKLVIADDDLIQRLQPILSKVEIFPVSRFADLEMTVSNTDVGFASPLNLAYVIYTSGTTGEPKGVMIEHAALVNYTCWAATNYCKGGEAVFPLYTSISFDLTITSIFVPLTTGNKIVIYQNDDKSPLIQHVVADNQVNIVKVTPSHLRLLLESTVLIGSDNRIKRFIVGGEKLDTALTLAIFEKFRRNVELYNEYGPTEATVGCMIHKFDSNENGESVPIGIPASNTQIYILDKFLKPVPIGVHGELHIAGDGLARGYLYDEELTNFKFIFNPFVAGKRMYKTGDIARVLADGMIEYVGRYDQQVKINGHRIELSEIESQLIRYPSITNVLVALRKNAKNQSLICAYYKSDSILEQSELRNYLINRLPHFMIPAYFISIDEIPLTGNGKIDYKGLPEPKIAAAIGLPKNGIEQISLGIWQDIFGESDLSVHSNFFELGGDSIKAAQISWRLFEKGIVINAKDILTYHTIEQVSLRATFADGKSKYEQDLVEGERSFVLIELWFFAQKFRNQNYYNQSILLKFTKTVDYNILQKAFTIILHHHDALRTNYDPDKNNIYYNRKHLDREFLIEVQEIDNASKNKTIVETCEKLKSSLDICDSLLLKAALLRENTSELLFITAHHLIIDGVSWRILLEDLYSLYIALEKGEPTKLPQKTASMVDWGKKLLEFSRSEEIFQEVKYWNEIASVPFNIPLDFETNEWSARNSNTVLGFLSGDYTRYLLTEAHRIYKTDVSILLNVALALMLKEWTGFDTFVIELENHGRHFNDIDSSRTIGWFTIMHPAKLKLNGESLADNIKAIKEQIKRIPNHGIGYGIHRYLNVDPDDNREGLSEIRFNYLGQFDRSVNNELFTRDNTSHGMDIDVANELTAKLQFNLMIMNDGLNVEINYNRQAHVQATIEWIRDTFIQKLEMILNHIKNEDDLHFTPSDFDAVDLEQEELDALFRGTSISGKIRYPRPHPVSI